MTVPAQSHERHGGDKPYCGTAAENFRPRLTDSGKAAGTAAPTTARPHHNRSRQEIEKWLISM